MFFSLLVPCYNAQKYIDTFLTNLGALQTPFNEVIFYDDASTDNTLQILRSKGLNVIAGQTNSGPGYARNKLAKAAKGDYIHFHDIDDEFNPFFLNLVTNKLKTTPTDVVLGNADWIDASSRETIIKWRYNETDIMANPLAYFINNPLGIINTVYKKESFLSIGGFNPDIKCWEDADLHVRLAANGVSFAVVNEVLACSIRHNEGISKNQLWCWACRLKFLKQYLANYSDILNKTILEAEVVRVKNVLADGGDYKSLADVIALKKMYGLSFSTVKISMLNMANKVIPTLVIKKIVSLLQGKS